MKRKAENNVGGEPPEVGDGWDLKDLQHPAQALEHPAAVVNDPGLTINEKRQAADVPAEQNVPKSEAQLSAILSQVPGAVAMFDRQGHVVLRGGLLSGLWNDSIPSLDPGADRHWRGFDAKGGLLSPSQYPGARALRGETTAPGLDFIYTADDGQETWIRVSAAPFRNEAGEIVGGVGIIQNVDQEKRAEQRLRESEARLQAAVDLLKLGRYAWNPQTNEVQWDEMLKAMWGLPPDAPVDYEVWRAGVHPDDRARVEAAVERCKDPRGDGVYDVEYRVIGKNGVERWIATRGRTDFLDHKPVSFYGVARDITDRKGVESRLEQLVEARTRELQDANRKLHSQIAQRAIAEAAVQRLQRLEAIGQITSGVAHDFNNLLSVVLTNARLLSRNLHDPGDREGIELIRTAAEQATNVTAQLLAFSRKQRLEPQEVDLNSEIVGMWNLLSATLGGTIQLRTKLAADLCRALVDPAQIESIILNLVINARDAMQAGGVLTLETFNAVIDNGPAAPEGPFPGRYVCLAVNDTGVGIPDDVLRHVFEPFFTTKEPGKGSGLGLAQVFGIAKQSGGGVEIETRVGAGTSVKVFLPRADFASDGRKRESRDAELGPQTKRTATILVVDDDKAVLRTTVRMFEALGHAAVAAESGREALELIATGLEIDLVFADIAMPEMSGMELAKTIHITHPALPVILATGYVDRQALKNFDEARILQKPYTEEELMEKIANALNQGDHAKV